MKKIKWISLILLVLLAGCSKEKPAQPGAEPAAKSPMRQAKEKIKELRKEEIPPEKLQPVAQQVYSLAVTAEELGEFKWALENGAVPNTDQSELADIYSCGEAWREPVLAKAPDTLPAFMNEAVKTSNVDFYNTHIETFTAFGPKLNELIDMKTFNNLHARFFGGQMTLALSKKDRERVAFLLKYAPKAADVEKLDSRTERFMPVLGSYVFSEVKDEQMACRLLELGYDYGRLDIASVGFGENFNKALNENPQNAVRFMGLHKEGDPLTVNDAKILLKLPVSEMVNLHPKHVDEGIQLCMEKGVSAGTVQFMNLRAKQRPFEKKDYIELMNWALKYGDEETYNLLRKKNGDLELNEINLSAIAGNQKMFERYAPKILENIEYIMEPERQPNGAVTLGEIYEVFENKNEKAGLYIVQKYDLEGEWVAATQNETMLMDVCKAGNFPAAKYLIEKKKADIGATTRFTNNESTLFGNSVASDGKYSAVFYAAKSGNSELIKYLKSKGADINARSHFGVTPLMFAVSGGHLDAVKTLIALGADVNAEMKAEFKDYAAEGYYTFDQLSTALRRANSYKYPEIAAELKKAGAKK